MSQILLPLVARYRRRGAMRLRPVNSVKNIIDSTTIGVAAGVQTKISLAETINAYTGANPKDVPIGAKVSAIYIFFQILPQAAQGQVDMFIGKFPPGVTVPAAGATGGSSARRFVLHEEKGIPGTFNNGASPLTFRGVIKIPRGKQRMAEGDEVLIKFACSTAYDACVKCIYKFYQ